MRRNRRPQLPKEVAESNNGQRHIWSYLERLDRRIDQLFILMVTMTIATVGIILGVK